MITVNFPPNISSLTAPGLTQYDTGQIISMTGTGITTETVQVHFAASGQSGAIVKIGTVLGGVITAEIPDSVLAMGRTITAWAYVIDGDARETRYTAVLPVVSRVRPQDYISPAEPPYVTANELLDRVETAETTVSALTTELTTARNGEASLDERLDGIDLAVGKKANTQQPEWITPTLENGFGGLVRYRINNFNQLEIIGALTYPTALSANNVPAFTLPLEYIPIWISGGIYTDSRLKFTIPRDIATLSDARASISSYNGGFFITFGAGGTKWHINLVIPMMGVTS